MHMTNLLSGSKVLKVSGSMTITDEVNGLVAEFTYGAKTSTAAGENGTNKGGKF